MGTVVVERRGGRHGAALTPVGEVLVAHGEQVMGQLIAARSDIAAVQAEGETLSIGVYQSVGVRLLPVALTDFVARRPDVRIRLQESNSDEDLLELVMDGELDLTFAVLPLGEAKLQFIEVIARSVCPTCSCRVPSRRAGEDADSVRFGGCRLDWLSRVSERLGGGGTVSRLRVPGQRCSTVERQRNPPGAGGGRSRCCTRAAAGVRSARRWSRSGRARRSPTAPRSRSGLASGAKAREADRRFRRRGLACRRSSLGR